MTSWFTDRNGNISIESDTCHVSNFPASILKLGGNKIQFGDIIYKIDNQGLTPLKKTSQWNSGSVSLGNFNFKDEDPGVGSFGCKELSSIRINGHSLQCSLFEAKDDGRNIPNRHPVVGWAPPTTPASCS